jgi:hypothetical protein
MLTTIILLVATGQQVPPRPTPVAAQSAVRKSVGDAQRADVVARRRGRKAITMRSMDARTAAQAKQAEYDRRETIVIQQHQMQMQNMINQRNSVALEAQHQQLQAIRLQQMARLQAQMERQQQVQQPQMVPQSQNIYEMQQRLYGNQ